MVMIPRLQRTIPLTNQDGTPTQAFHQWWDQVAKNIESAFLSLTSQIAAIAAAQATANAAKLNDKLSASSTAPTAILSAADIGGGAGANITVASHTRKYGDATTATVVGGVITPLAYSTTYAVYYDDVTTSVTNPTFLATSTLKDGQFNAASGRHYCGQITTPANGGGGTSGGGPVGTGGGGPYP